MQSKVKYSDILKRGLKETPTQCLLVSLSLSPQLKPQWWLKKPQEFQNCGYPQSIHNFCHDHGYNLENDHINDNYND